MKIRIKKKKQQTAKNNLQGWLEVTENSLGPKGRKVGSYPSEAPHRSSSS